MNIEGLDRIDNGILEIIKENARAGFSEIGQQVGISRVSVKKRMESMQEKGIIRGYRTVIDEEKAADGIRFFLDIEATPDRYEEVLECLTVSKMARQVYGVSGECRIHVIGYASNMKNLEYFANFLYRNQRGIRRLDCRTVLSTIKDVDGGVEYERYKEPEHLEV